MFHRGLVLICLVPLLMVITQACAPASPEAPVAEADRTSVDPAGYVKVDAASDPQAIEIAQRVVETMGGWQGWEDTRYVSWRFFGGRRWHLWDRHTGDLRLEIAPENEGDATTLVLMNIVDRDGRVLEDGVALEGEALEQSLEQAYRAWINDAYWMFLPYKLLDPGVTLTYGGEATTVAGAAADVLVLTFDGVGVTPENRYHVLVGRETGLVEQWDYYREASQQEPDFRMPWLGWKRFGGIHLATDHGRGANWLIAVHDDLPASYFDSPDATGLLDPGADSSSAE